MRVVAGGLVGLLALVFVGMVTAAVPDSGLSVVVFGVCSAASGILAAFSYRRVSPPFAISHVCAFAGGTLVAEWMGHGLGAVFGNAAQSSFEPDVRLYAPLLVSFIITLFILEFRGSPGAGGANGQLSEPPPPSTPGGGRNSKRQAWPSSRRSPHRRRRPPTTPRLGDRS